MLCEEINGIEQELQRYEQLIKEQMDEEAQQELDQLIEKIVGEEDRLETLQAEEAKITQELQTLVTQGDELEFECSWVSQRENQKFEALMTQEVSCHLLSNRPFVCSLHSPEYVSQTLIPGKAEMKLVLCAKVYLQIISQMYLNTANKGANKRVCMLIISDNPATV